MSTLKISVESTCDLPSIILDKYSISLISMEYGIDGNTYVMGDGTHTMQDFYNKMRDGSATKTSMINEYTATEYLKTLLDKGLDVIHLAFSSSLSGTYNSFVQAKEQLQPLYPDRKIAVVDSLSACAGQGIYAVYVAEYATSHTFEETVEYAEQLKNKIIHFFVVDDLKYLARGGRISKATALLGNTIHMKPVMHMNKEGSLVAYKKVISRKKSLLEIANLTAQKIAKDADKIYIAHADCLEEAQFVADHVEKSVGIKPELMDLGMIIGSHSGPGTIACFFMGEARE